MLLDRHDQYQIEVELRKSKIKLTLIIDFVLNQSNINSDGEYFFKFKNITDSETGNQITDPVVKQEIANNLVEYFYKNTTNFIGLTISQLIINV